MVLDEGEGGLGTSLREGELLDTVVVRKVLDDGRPFGEIEANTSDPKHVESSMRPSDGLGVLGLTGLGVMEPL